MPVSKNQMKRIMLLVAELKKNNFPNCVSFARLVARDASLGEVVSTKTIQRDFEALKNEFGAPLVYDFENKGFKLTHDGWSFNCSYIDDAEMLAMVCGAEIAERVFPEPLSSKMRDAVNCQLSENSLGLNVDRAYLDTLLIFSDLNVRIEPGLFSAVFEAWKGAETLDIVYQNDRGGRSERTIEPHVLAYRDRAWYINALCHKTEEFRNFAVHRMISARRTGKHFIRDHEAVLKVREKGLYNYVVVTTVVLACDARSARILAERPLHKDQKARAAKGGKTEFTIPSIGEEELIRWLLSFGGLVSVVSPKRLRGKIADMARTLLKSHAR